MRPPVAAAGELQAALATPAARIGAGEALVRLQPLRAVTIQEVLSSLLQSLYWRRYRSIETRRNVLVSRFEPPLPAPSGSFQWKIGCHSLPAEDAPPPSSSPNPLETSLESGENPGGTRSAPSILLIEDNSSDVYVVRQLLKQSGLGATLQVAVDGEQALSIIQEIGEQRSRPLPAIVLLDWNLPKVSGAEVLTQLGRSGRWKTVPVVVVTSTNSPEELAEMDRLGAAAHFRKPTDLDAYLALGDLIRRTLSREAEK